MSEVVQHLEKQKLREQSSSWIIF